MPYGKYFDDLEPGDTFDHWPGRTITEFDDTFFSLMSMNQHPLHIDDHFAKGTQHRQRLVEGPLVISLVIGISQADVGGRALRTLEYSNIRHHEPVFHGDTIYARSRIVAKEILSDASAMVRVQTEGFNQNGAIVVTLERFIELPRRSAV